MNDVMQLAGEKQEVNKPWSMIEIMPKINQRAWTNVGGVSHPASPPEDVEQTMTGPTPSSSPN